MPKHPVSDLEPNHLASPLVLRVLRVRVRGDVAIDIFANAALRWLCRAGVTPGMRVVGVVR
jgi:hypothetical protein